MHALARAWTESGGHVIGLAPSAAAAAALRDQLGAATDTLAKLTHAIGAGALPDWADQIGPTTLVVLDEAAMADTLSLDAALTWVLGRGGSVRLIGDDRQLSAIGAGGVLRDIEATHGALRLTELLRFTEVAEAAASLALREGDPAALGYYLDHHRVHVGDLATMTEDAFTAWQLDRGRGLDALMLAPTRALAAELNQRARAHRLAGADHTGPAVALADGARAGVGDVVITRVNDRRLRLSATDWVKNGDRWLVSAVHGDGSLSVHHTRHHLRVHLPADYVAASVDLGYATTIHTAQGVTADTMHGLLTGTESRQQLYTMLTRGRNANHLYLEVVGDGDPHTVIRPETIHPPTATDLLTAVLARDDSPTSATTQHRTATEPAVRLGPATDRYSDALTVAAERLAGAAAINDLTHRIDAVLPGLDGEPAWPALRGHLLLLGLDGTDPLPRLTAAADRRDLDDAADRAAVLHWRLAAGAAPGPLPWLPAIPDALTTHPTWGPYLTARATLVAGLAAQVAETAEDSEAARTSGAPAWTRHLATHPSPELRRDIAVWRAATSIPDSDPRPLGPHRGIGAAADWQSHLRRRLAAHHGDALAEWKPLLTELHPPLTRDDYTPQLAHQLAVLSRAGLPAANLIRDVASGGPLPDDHAAAALWWRITGRLGPAAALDATHTVDPGASPTWWPDLAAVLGQDRAATLTASPWWPALATGIGHALARGWTLPHLLGSTPDTGPDPGLDLDLAQALAWRTSVLIDPPADPDHEPGPPLDDLWTEIPPWHDLDDDALHPWTPDLAVVDETAPGQDPDDDPDDDLGVDEDAPDIVEADLALLARIRAADRPLGPSDADIEAQIRRANAHDSDIPLDRLRAVIAAAHDYYQAQLPGSWAHQHLLERFGHDLAGHPHYAPGYAPAGWTALCEHLGARGVTPDELLTTGLATRSRRGTLIDRFRDRAVFPITDHRTGHVIAFTARHHPRLDADQDSPKYLNTPETVLFHKGSHLFGYIPALIDAGAIPVRVEGSTDAIAVTLATGGRYIGLAPLGTSLTREQATLLAHTPRARDLVIATDADTAGRLAAERDYWLLTPHGLDPRLAPLPDGSDPADLLARRGPGALSAALAAAGPAGEVLLDERLTNLTGDKALIAAVAVLTARPPTAWEPGALHIAARLGRHEHDVCRALRDNLRTWIKDPRAAAATPITYLRDVRDRIQPNDRPPERTAQAPGRPISRRPHKATAPTRTTPR
jgi:DNA primase catalytic core